ncbi:MAG: raiA [Clostridiales bacterium]|nr:raiA [Clostridiales bacterium]
MKFMITGKNIALTDALKNTVEKKLGKLEKYFNPEVEIHATLSVQKTRQIIEVTIPFNGILLRGEESTTDMYSSIDNVVDKLEKQIMKHRTRLERRTHEGSLRLMNVPSEVVEEDEPQVVRTKRFAVKPMDADEAVLQMDLLGHDFFVFRNADSNEVNVVYKRKDGNYGLIEPEF